MLGNVIKKDKGDRIETFETDVLEGDWVNDVVLPHRSDVPSLMSRVTKCVKRKLSDVVDLTRVIHPVLGVPMHWVHDPEDGQMLNPAISPWDHVPWEDGDTEIELCGDRD